MTQHKAQELCTLAEEYLYHQETAGADKARQLLLQAIPLIEAKNDMRNLASAYNNLAFATILLHDWNEGERLLRKSLRMHKSLKNRTEIAVCQNSLGNVAHNRNQLRKAEKLYKKSLKQHKIEKNYAEMANVSNNLGLLAQKHDKLEGAEVLFNEAKRLYALTGHVKGVERTEINLARTELLKSERNIKEKAKEITIRHIYWEKTKKHAKPIFFVIGLLATVLGIVRFFLDP